MKVLFTASHRGKKYFDENYKTIYELLTKHGYKHVSDSLITVNPTKYYEELGREGYEGYMKDYDRMIKNIQTADVIVFESSFPSIGIGFMIQKAIDMNKPVIVFYLKDNLPTFLSGIQEEKFQLVQYTEKNLEEKLKEALERANTLADKRFNFFISPSLLNYLNKVGRTQGITKSMFIRNLIVEHKKKYDK